MIVLEALNALYGDCLLLRFTDGSGIEKLWIIDGGPRSETIDGKPFAVWRDVLLPRLREITDERPIPVSLGVVSHIDDDHINGIQRLTNILTASGPGNPPEVKFARFWFNSFEAIIGQPATQGLVGAGLQTQNLLPVFKPHFDDEDAEAVIESVGQGISLAADLKTLHIGGNAPVGGLISAVTDKDPIMVDGATVTILGPRQNRLDALREEWMEALAKPSKEAKEAAIAALFLPNSKLDKSVPNLSSLAMLVKIRGKRILLTGDAQGKDLAEAWDELGFSQEDTSLDILKMPHHGSSRNTPEVFLRKFPARHYVISANGKYDNPDPQVVEAIVKLNRDRKFTIHFTNSAVKWSKPYTTESGQPISDLPALIEQLKQDYQGVWDVVFRELQSTFVAIELEE
ncbi:ComEC/Rec2 family competence protein [Rhizobium ruizarguesonis]